MAPPGLIPVLRLLDVGRGASIQDRGRPGWARYGVPAGGCMDRQAAAVVNRLLDNDPAAPVLELLLDGARLVALEPVWVALCGAACEASIPLWRACHIAAGEIVHIRRCSAGLWSCLAVEAGFCAPQYFGSASYYARGPVGETLAAGSVLQRHSPSRFSLPPGVSGRVAPWSEQRDYSAPPPIRVWPGPQWKNFSTAARDLFLKTAWRVSPNSDRVGFRLEGPALAAEPPELVSEPVLPGSVQVPQNGQPILTMRDGPTLGGYPKIALVEPSDLSWAAQTRPGQSLRFKLLS